ncbi:hypothetical protein [Oricola indica]|jgi:hypothetical protein|uniref:hypothetical protein n=1 Tax=Oricola indica TaxID=2872591 RepID=UPI001CC11B7B|nr:hypothetical protein [Oricola indica]
MKNAFATTALAAMLSMGTLAGASAMPTVNAPAADTASTAKVELVGHRGHNNAQRGHHRIMPRHVIKRHLHRQGFRNIRNMRLVRGDYVLLARGYRGPVRLVVDGRSGRVLSRHVLRGGHRPGFVFRGGNGNFSYSFGIR